MSEPPIPRYELTLTIQGNTLDEVYDELVSLERMFYLDGRSPADDSPRDEWEIYSGRSARVMTQRNPDMTPERYAAELGAWAAERKANR